MAKEKRRKNGTNGRRRQNNTGTLEQRGGKWLARWYVRDMQGRRIRRSQRLTATTLEEARAQLRDLTEGNALITREREIEKNLSALEGVAAERKAWEESLPALSITDAFAAYCRSPLRPDSGDRTLSDYKGYFKGLCSWLSVHHPEIKELRQIGNSTVEEFLGELRDSRSSGTYNKRVVFFRKMWAVLAEGDEGKEVNPADPQDRPAKLTANPWERIRKRLPHIHSRRELTVEELGKIIKASEGEMKTLFAIGIYTGLRLGDCCLLDWGETDLERGLITVRPRKTRRRSNGKPVVIPIHPTLAELLAQTPPALRKGAVLPETAAIYSKRSVTIIARIQRFFAKCGIKTSSKDAETGRLLTDVGFHSLRHTFVSLSANAGTPLAVVQSIVGHSNPAMTQHYFHENKAALTAAVGALPDVTTHEEAPETKGLERFKKAYARLTSKEKAQARRWLAAQDPTR